MTIKIDNRSVFITGTSTGIGRAAAIILDQLGFLVFASVRKEVDAENLSKEASGRLNPILLDVTDMDSIFKARDIVAESVGQAGLWGLVNNAGITFRAPIEFIPMEELRRLYETNVFGLSAVTQAFLPLIRQAGGRIINISSSASQIITPFHGPYCSAKLAVNGITNTLRLELTPFNIQVSLMMLGGFQTPIWERVKRNTAEITKRFPSEFNKLYAERQKNTLGFFFAKGEKGLSPDIAAKAIIHALTAKRAKNTYFVGSSSKLFNLLDKVVYGRLREWVTLRTMRLAN